LLGHSAGAHLVALLNADPALAAAQDSKPWRAAVVIDSAALDVETLMTHRHLPLHDQAFGSDPAFWRLASPLQRLQRAPVAPMLLVCAAAREDSCAAAQALVDRTLAVGGHAELLALALDHFEINAALGSPGAYTEAVDDFLARADLF
ncbi:MAG: alpha/beta hydrolase, partial [Rubrivivax sp.]